MSRSGGQSRRRALALLGATAFGSLGRRGWSAADPTAGAGGLDEWPQFRGDPQLRGLARSAPPSPLTVAWSLETGTAIDSSAAIAAGLAFVGTQGGDLLALDLATGAKRWTYATGAEIGESSPAVAEGLVYVGDLRGFLHAVNVADGKKVWTFKTGTEVKSSPVVASGKVLLGSYDHKVYALDARTGAVAWSFETEGQVHATAAVADGVAHVTGCDALLRGIRIADGKEVFQVSSEAYTGASPALAGGRAYYGTFENEVLCVDLAARKVSWRYQHAERHFPFYSSAAVTDGRVVIGGRDKLVHALDATTGKAAWTFTTKGRVDSSPAIAGGKVYVGSGDGRLYVLDLKSGVESENFDTGAPITASPAIAQGRLLLGNNDGALYCFGKKA